MRRIEVSDLVEPFERFGHAFGMRVIRAAEDVVGARERDEAFQIILPKGFDPGVEDVAAVFKEQFVSPSARCEPSASCSAVRSATPRRTDCRPRRWPMSAGS